MLYQSSFRTLSISIVFLILFASGLLRAQYAPDKQPFEISPDETIRTEINRNSSINIETGYPIALYGVNTQVIGNTPEEMASNYLKANISTFGLSYPDLSDLSHHHTRTTNMGHVVRFRQVYQGLPVNKSELTVTIDLQNTVTFVMNTYQPNVSVKDVQPKFTATTAMSMAKDHINASGNIKYQRSELMIYANRGQARLAYKMTVGADRPLGDWRIYVDAITQELFKAVDVAAYCRDHDHNNSGHTCNHDEKLSTPVDGIGNVFDPDPLSSAQVAYGTGGFTDNNDLDSPDLNGELVSVILKDIDFTGGVYTLKGPWAEIVDTGSPSTGLFTQATSNFSYNRGDDAFEAVNTYYHIDSSMRYINFTLTEPLTPYQYVGGVQFDPQGASGDDNSFYNSGDGYLEFGEGCVDDAEDSDVIHHELGHGIHDWITMGNLSQVDGLSEGCGDYWAQSYNRAYNGWTSADPAYNYVFNWDGHNICWGGRITDYAASYPVGLVGQVHTDGQIWSTCMMTVWDAIGQQKTDKIFLSGLSMTNGSANQNDAANAAYQAAQNLNYPLADLLQIYTLLTGCGYTLPLPPNAPPIADFSSDETVVCTDIGGTVNFTDVSLGNPTAWTWSFPGATPASSTMQNPTVAYATDGTYPVTLIATNANGADTSMVMSYITVVSGANCPNCISTAATDVPIVISSSGTPTITSQINMTSGGVISDVNITNLVGVHTWITDLSITLTSPAGTTVSLMNRPCNSEEDFDLGYDDDAATGTLPCPPVGGGMYIPDAALATFNGENPQGNWTLTIVDNANQDGGSLNGWTLEVCFTSNSSCNLQATTSSTAATGANADGTATAIPVGGTAPYTYLWDDGQTTQTAINLIAGAYTVTITDTDGCQLIETVTVALASSTSDLEDLANFELYPNPTDGQFTVLVEFDTAEKASLAIYNVLGQELFTTTIDGKSNAVAVEMTDEAAGVYFVSLKTEKGSAVVRFVKN